MLAAICRFLDYRLFRHKWGWLCNVTWDAELRAPTAEQWRQIVQSHLDSERETEGEWLRWLREDDEP